MLTNPSPAFQPIVPTVLPSTIPSATPSMITPGVPTMINRAVTPAPTVVQPGTVPTVLQPPVPPEQLWKQKFPGIASGILSSVQALVAIVIIGCEIGSMLVDIFTATIYVGLWAGVFFMIAWICQAASACCCRSRGCASYTLVMQFIAAIFACCVIGFDSYYLVSPSTCFFPTLVCNGTVGSRGVFYSQSNFDNVKMSLIKGQLAAGCLMLVLCLVYIIIYLVVTYLVYQAKKTPSVHPQLPYQQQLPTGADGMILAPPLSNIRPHRMGSPLYYRPQIAIDNGDGRANDLLCPTCSTMMAVTVKKRPPQ